MSDDAPFDLPILDPAELRRRTEGSDYWYEMALPSIPESAHVDDVYLGGETAR